MLLSPRQRLWLVMGLLSTSALAQRDTTRDALSRLEERLPARLADPTHSLKDYSPVLVVSVAPAFEQTRAWFPGAALTSLTRIFGAGALRACEACMAQRLMVENGRLEQLSTSLTVRDLARLDEVTRGVSAPAIAAVWLDETALGVSVRVIDLRNGLILYAENVDPSLQSMVDSKETVKLAEELDRRSRGLALTHTFIDIGVAPQQHVSVDWLEQWGPDNANLSGFTLSFLDPLIGIGASYFRVIPPALNLMVGAKVLVSVPSAFIAAVAPDQNPNLLGDNLITGLLMARLPIFNTSFALELSISTNGRFTAGVSLLNFTLFPFLP